MKTRSIGIRLPVALWELAKAGAPDKSYSEIVGCALNEVFGFDEHEDIFSRIPVADHKLDTVDIEAVPDSWDR